MLWRVTSLHHQSAFRHTDELCVHLPHLQNQSRMRQLLCSASSSLKRVKATVTQQAANACLTRGPAKIPLPYPKLLLLLSFVMDEEAPVTIVFKIYALILVRGGRELIICRLPHYLTGPAGCGTLSLSLVILGSHPRFISSRWHAAFLCTLYRVIISPPPRL